MGIQHGWLGRAFRDGGEVVIKTYLSGNEILTREQSNSELD